MYYLLLILVITLQLTILYTIYSKDIRKNMLRREARKNPEPTPLVSSMKGIVKSKIKPKSLNTSNVNKVLGVIKERNIPFSYYEGTGQLTFIHNSNLVNYFFTTGTLLHNGTKEVEYPVNDLIKKWLTSK